MLHPRWFMTFHDSLHCVCVRVRLSKRQCSMYTFSETVWDCTCSHLGLFSRLVCPQTSLYSSAHLSLARRFCQWLTALWLKKRVFCIYYQLYRPPTRWVRSRRRKDRMKSNTWMNKNPKNLKQKCQTYQKIGVFHCNETHQCNKEVPVHSVPLRLRSFHSWERGRELWGSSHRRTMQRHLHKALKKLIYWNEAMSCR